MGVVTMQSMVQPTVVAAAPAGGAADEQVTPSPGTFAAWVTAPLSETAAAVAGFVAWLAAGVAGGRGEVAGDPSGLADLSLAFDHQDAGTDPGVSPDGTERS